MKRRLFFIFTLSLSSIGLFAQSDLDAYKLSRNDLRGSARAVAMGGAFGALGGDMTGVSINPAGIGAYTQAEVATTLNFENKRTETSLNAGVTDMSKFKFNFDNISYVGTFPLSSDAVSSINFGFAFNRLKNFDRKIKAGGNGLSSISKYIANRTNLLKVTDNDLAMKNSGEDPLANYDWLPVIGYNSWLTEPTAPGSTSWKSALTADPQNSNLYIKEKGRIDSYDFNFGFDISEIVGVGASLSVTDISYNLYSDYEEYFGTIGGSDRGFYLTNGLTTEGAGIQAKLGVILKPINEFRIGIAYHSPTWYNMTDTYAAEIDHNLEGYLSAASSTNYEKGTLRTGTDYLDYRLKTPDKWVFSLASVIAQRAIISVDYELTNYQNMTLKEDYGSYTLEGNDFIKDDFKMASTLRVGAEIRFTPQISGRVGYAWMQSPLTNKFKNQDDGYLALPAGTVPHYTLDGDTHHFTYGLGYRFTRNFYGDIAFVMKWQEDDIYAFPPNDAYTTAKGTLKTNTVQGLVTLGYRF